MAKVFIGMPVYNGERFLGEAIESLRAQTFTDWELFISDDASTDGSRAICEEYAEKDPRITYFRQEQNIGQFKNFGFLVGKGTGEYFMWAAQDDFWERDFIRVCVEHLENNPALGIAMTGVAQINSRREILRGFPEFPSLSGMPSIFTIARYVLQPEILGKCLIMYALFRIEAMRKVWAVYPQRYEWGSDYIFSLAAISHFGIEIDPKVLFKKRRGGFADPIKIDSEDKMTNIVGNPRNQIFPFGRFKNYFNGHMEALKGTPYRYFVAILLLIRLPRAFLIYIKERNYKKFLRI